MPSVARATRAGNAVAGSAKALLRAGDELERLEAALEVGAPLLARVLADGDPHVVRPLQRREDVVEDQFVADPAGRLAEHAEAPAVADLLVADHDALRLREDVQLLEVVLRHL